MPFLLTAVAMVAFAANSLLARLALADGAMGPLAFTGVRLAAAALVLAALMAREGRLGRALPGSWPSALALAVYALAFSLAYVRLGAAIGALILFALVQITMISWSLMRGERPGLIEWLGIGAALAGFVALVFPRLGAPDPLAAGLMVASGIAWGIYSLRGKGEPDPIGATAGNFLRAAPIGIGLIGLALVLETWTLAGIAAGLASGALASGLGYVVWYRAVRRATGTQAAVVQLTAPALAAVGATLLLGEPMTLHIVVSGALILLGVLVAVLAPKPVRA